MEVIMWRNDYSFYLSNHAALRFAQRYKKIFHRTIPKEFVNLGFIALIDEVEMKQVYVTSRVQDSESIFFSFKHQDNGIEKELVLIVLEDSKKGGYLVKTIMSLEMLTKKNIPRAIMKECYNRARFKRESKKIVSAVGF
ncbi:MAG: hypothetical protein Q7J14_02090 [Candidatus Magasanikbacteria bacterium]|nr:hypothetical protein [Candidatus Magasanikbacteria bacterium]